MARFTHVVVTSRDLGIADKPIALEHPDGTGRCVETRALPVASEVCLLGQDLAEIAQFFGRHDGSDIWDVTE